MTLYHALVWIDHREAKVFHFNTEKSQEVVVRTSHAHQNLHHKANAGDSGHAPVDKEYLGRVIAEIAKAGAILVVGPGTAKIELRTLVEQSRPDVAAKIHAVEAMDHPTEGQLLAYGRKFFVADDRMHLQVPTRA